MICQGVIGHALQMPNKISEVPFCPVKKRFFQKLQFYYLGQSCFSILLLSPLEEGVTLHFNKLDSPLRKDTLCQVWLKLTQQFLRRRVLKVINVFHYVTIIYPMKKAFHLTKIQIHFTNEYFESSSTEIFFSGLEEIFKNCQHILPQSLQSPLRKKQSPSFERKLNPLKTRMLCTQFG